MTRIASCCFGLFCAGIAHGQESFTGVTFAGDRTLYVPLRQVGEALGYPVGFRDGEPSIAYRPVEDQRSLPDGTTLVPARAFEAAGASVSWNAENRTATISTDELSIQVTEGAKRVLVDKTSQRLKAYQGDLLVLETPISSGREGHRTPNGSFKAGPYKARMHRSKLYDDAPMPWSIQVTGNIFLHGYSSVPDVPASHGCIRLPTSGVNPAKWLYNWVDVGTPIMIEGTWNHAD